MPRLLSMMEIKFVSLLWEEDPRGHSHETVTDPKVVASYKRYFDEQLVDAQLNAKLCAESHVCAQRPDGEHMCEFRIRKIKEDMYTPRRPKLVKITIPTDKLEKALEAAATTSPTPDAS